MSFAEVLKQVKSLSYEVIIFDTAPTGHTLRFLQFPTVLEKALAKVSQLSTQFGPMLNSVIGARGGLPGGQNLDDLIQKMEALRETIGEVNTQFKNPEMTTFVCVCIAEFLSLYETERMIQELASYEIDTHCIVVNQLLFPKKSNQCEQCNARRKMQLKYLDQIEELYDEFNVVKMPLLVEEVRGKEKLERYGNPMSDLVLQMATNKHSLVSQKCSFIHTFHQSRHRTQTRCKRRFVKYRSEQKAFCCSSYSALNELCDKRDPMNPCVPKSFNYPPVKGHSRRNCT
jgi:anion-transporting  ArsA/GET3 family ATPase